MAREQKRLLQQAFHLLKPGGTLVYSTCTLEPEENEGVISWFLTQREDAQLEEITIPLKRSLAVTSWEGRAFHPDVEKCLRIYPQDNDTEGFFVAKLRKVSGKEE